VAFPVQFEIWGFSVHAHLILELAGYAAGSQLFFFLGRRMRGPRLPMEQTVLLVLGCLAGALLGSRLLALVESIHAYWPYRHDPRILLSGKTIAGGLAGGWLGVEIVKREHGIKQMTGDRFVFPLLLGTCIGRVGCFLEGLPDHTYGIATSLPWGVDFGDGIRRHPTQLYEIAFCVLLGAAILFRMRRPYQNGELFRLYMIGYFAWRFFVEFIKPRETCLGLSPIQMTSCIVVLIAWRSWRKLRDETPNLAVAHA
jgi:prolipoprotein diacylglyceryltransferase